MFVFGPEADLSWTRFKGKTTTTNTLCGGVDCQTSNDWLGTLRARVGYGADRFLAFGTFGIEVATTDNLSAKIEYLFVDLGSATCVTTASNCGPIAACSAVSLTSNVIRLGVNYRFGP